MFHDFDARYGRTLPTLRGDYTGFWEDGAASTAVETAVNRNAAEAFAQDQSLFAILSPSRYPDAAFRDAWKKYQDAQVTIIGVSRDSEESHRKFVAEHQLPFPLAADEKGDIEKSYGVSSTLGMTSRVTFLIAPDGKIAHVWPDVDPGVHASEVLDAASKIQP